MNDGPHNPGDGSRKPPDPNGNAAYSPSAAFLRFIKSMEMTFDMWHDGEGYDLAALDELTDAERRTVAEMLRSRRDWRDVEALAHLNPPDRSSLRTTFADEHAPMITRLRAGEELERLGEEVEFVPLVLTMLDAADGNVSIMSRLFDFLEWRNGKPPANDPRVKLKILRQLMATRDASSTNWAAIAFVVFGLCKSQWDWQHRPFWLRFQERDEHDVAFDELLSMVGVTRADLTE